MSFELQDITDDPIDEQTYYDQGILMVAMVAGAELAYETMVSAGIIEESAYYESLHETPLIANTIARKKLYEMNVVISDTADMDVTRLIRRRDPAEELRCRAGWRRHR